MKKKQVQGAEFVKKRLIVRILPNGEIQMETEGMYDDECVPYAKKLCAAIEAIPIGEPDFSRSMKNTSQSLDDTQDDFLPQSRRQNLYD